GPARGGDRRDHLVDRAVEQLSCAESRKAPQIAGAEVAGFYVLRQRIAQLCLGVNGQQLEARRGAPHFAHQAVVEALLLTCARKQRAGEALVDVGLLIAIEAAGDAAPEYPPVDFVLNLIAELQAG